MRSSAFATWIQAQQAYKAEPTPENNLAELVAWRAYQTWLSQAHRKQPRRDSAAAKRAAFNLLKP